MQTFKLLCFHILYFRQLIATSHRGLPLDHTTGAALVKSLDSGLKVGDISQHGRI